MGRQKSELIDRTKLLLLLWYFTSVSDGYQLFLKEAAWNGVEEGNRLMSEEQNAFSSMFPKETEWAGVGRYFCLLHLTKKCVGTWLKEGWSSPFHN